MCKALCKCIAAFDYFDKTLLVLQVIRSGSVSIASLATVIGATIEVTSEALVVLFSVLRKMCSENMQQFYRRTPMPKCDFNKVALQLY